MAGSEDERVVIHPSLVTKDGRQTSSYVIAIISALTPVMLLIICILGLVYVSDPKAQQAFLYLLVAVVVPGIAAGGAVGWKFISARGDVAVAKTQALGQVLTAQLSPDASTKSPEVTATSEMTLKEEES